MAGLHRLSAAAVRAAKAPDTGKRRLSDGGGLHLLLRPNRSPSWVVLYTPRGGNRREKTLGTYPALSLADARTMAAQVRSAVAKGDDPRELFRPTATPTFLDAARGALEARPLDKRSPKSTRQWERDLLERAKPLHARPVGEVHRDDVLRLLRPVWKATPESGRRFRFRLEAVFSYAKARGWRDGENPAAWRDGLQHVLPAHPRQTAHLPAMPWADVPAFIARLQEREAVAALALETLILTTARTGEVLGMRWPEIDLDARTWTLPASRTKSGRVHTIPLPDRAACIIRELGQARVSEFVFPGQRQGRPLSQMSMLMLMRRMDERDAVPHGFRASFRMWSTAMGYSRELGELQLGHALPTALVKTYQRDERALEPRRPMMARWAKHCAGRDHADVVQLHG